jgi:hypothetical protein
VEQGHDFDTGGRGSSKQLLRNQSFTIRNATHWLESQINASKDGARL